MDRKLHSPFEARFGFPLLEAWAMTETGAGAVIIASKPRHIGSSCFGAEEDVQVRIVTDAGVEAATANPASCWCATPATIRATVSSPAT